MLAAVGTRHDLIAEQLGISEDTLKRIINESSIAASIRSTRKLAVGL
jgi:DNA invertase Pin-like site-specific DNA recombinase